jgi:hypothetical protein
LIWKLIKPHIPQNPPKDFVERKAPPVSLNIDKTQIEDANFKEIDEPREKSDR